MKILFLTNAYPDSESSYRGVFIKKLASLLQEDGYQISIVTPKIYKESHYFEEQDGIKVYRFPFFAGDKLLIEYQKIPYLRMLLYFANGFLLTFYAALRNGCRRLTALRSLAKSTKSPPFHTTTRSRQSSDRQERRRPDSRRG